MSSIIRNEWGNVAHIPTVNQTVFERFSECREFTVMQVLACINQQLTPDDRLGVMIVSHALACIARNDDRIRRIAAGRYTWSWNLRIGPRCVEEQTA